MSHCSKVPALSGWRARRPIRSSKIRSRNPGAGPLDDQIGFIDGLIRRDISPQNQALTADGANISLNRQHTFPPLSAAIAQQGESSSHIPRIAADRRWPHDLAPLHSDRTSNAFPQCTPPPPRPARRSQSRSCDRNTRRARQTATARRSSERCSLICRRRITADAMQQCEFSIELVQPVCRAMNFVQGRCPRRNQQCRSNAGSTPQQRKVHQIR